MAFVANDNQQLTLTDSTLNLNIKEKTSFEEQPLSDRTLSRFRARVLAYETEHDAEKLIELCDKTADLDDTSEYQHLITLN